MEERRQESRRKGRRRRANDDNNESIEGEGGYNGGGGGREEGGLVANLETIAVARKSRGSTTLEGKRGQQRQNAADKNPNVDKNGGSNNAAEETKNEGGKGDNNKMRTTNECRCRFNVIMKKGKMRTNRACVVHAMRRVAPLLKDANKGNCKGEERRTMIS